MVSLIIGLMSSILYLIAMIVIIGGVLILPFIIKGGWIAFVIIVLFIIMIGKGDNNENRN